MKNKIKRGPVEKVEPENLLDSVEVELISIKVKSDTTIRKRLALTCIGIVVFSIIAAYIIIILVGVGMISELPDGFLNWLGAATIGTIITNVLIVYKSVFPTNNSTDSLGGKR